MNQLRLQRLFSFQNAIVYEYRYRITQIRCFIFGKWIDHSIAEGLESLFVVEATPDIICFKTTVDYQVFP